MAKPAQNKTTKIRINILHPQGESLEITGRFLKWLTGYGRFIIILVEVVVLICFFLRFALEAQSKSLSDQITSQSDQIKALSSDEKLIKQTQIKIAQVKQNYDTNPAWSQIVNKIAARTPQTTIINSLGLDHTQASKSLQFKIAATTSSNADIGVFLNALKEDSLDAGSRSFSNVNLTGITYDEGILTFSITGSTN